jgi:hypothetical protein
LRRRNWMPVSEQEGLVAIGGAREVYVIRAKATNENAIVPR